MLYHGVTLGGTGKDVRRNVTQPIRDCLVSTHAQIIPAY